MHIRASEVGDADSIWAILEPAIRAGETYTLPSTMSRELAMLFCMSPGHEVFVAEESGRVVGTYFLRQNQGGGGAHVANCGYVTAEHATGHGVGRAMCAHSLDHARSRGFSAMQFNFVVSTNHRAIRLWESLGFNAVGRLPSAFRRPGGEFVDAIVMFRVL